MQWINAIIQGILLGGLYALLAAGLSLMFGVMRIVNLAHGALAILAAYVGLVIVQGTGVSPFLALVAVVPIMAGGRLPAAVGHLQPGTARGRPGAPARRLRSGGGAHPAAAAEVQRRQPEPADRQPRLSRASTSRDDISIGVLPLITFVVGVLVIFGLQMFLSKAPLGRAMRAASDDPETVPLMGIDNRQVYALSTAIALGTVGIAGMFLGMRGNFDPSTDRPCSSSPSRR